MAIHEPFRQPVLDLFSGHQAAHLGALYYLEKSARLSLEPWVKQPTRTNFYGRETALSETLLPTLSEVCHRGLPLVDLGPGGPSSVARRAVPIAGAIQSRCYVPVDISEAFLRCAQEVMNGAYHNLEVLPVQADFFARPLDLSVPTPRVVYFGGSTISNLPLAVFDHFPWTAYQTYMKHLADLAGNGGHLLLGWHAAELDCEALAPYQGSLEVTYYLETPLRVLTEWGATGLTNENWRCSSLWHPRSSCVSHGFTAQKACEVTFSGSTFRYPPGHRLIITPSFKIPLGIMAELAQVAGFSIIAQMGGRGEYALWLLAVT